MIFGLTGKLKSIPSFDLSFLRSFFILLLGSSVAQVIPIALSPVLTRIYSPSDYGIFGSYLAITSIGMVIASGRLDMAIFLPNEDTDASHVTMAALLISFVFCMLFAVVGNLVLFFWPKLTEHHYLVKLLPLSVFVSTCFGCFINLINRKKQYKQMNKSRINQVCMVGAGQYGLGVSKISSGLLVGDVFAKTISVIILYLQMKKNFYFSKFDKKKFYSILFRYRKFPIFEMPASLLNTLSYQLPYLCMPILFSTSVSGFYFLVYKVLMLPASLAGTAVLEVFRNKVTEAYNRDGECKSIVFKVMLVLLLVSILPTMIIMIFGPYIFKLFFGSSWGVAGEYARVLAPLAMLRFVSAPLSYMFFLREALKMDFKLQFFYLLMVCLAVVIAKYNRDPLVFAVSLSGLGCLFYIIQIIISFKLSSNNNFSSRKT